MKSKAIETRSNKPLLIKALLMLTPLVIFSTSIIAVPQANAHSQTISTNSSISNGQRDPAPIIIGEDFAPFNDKFDFIVEMGTTGLEFDSVAYVDSTHMRFNFHGIAKEGTISIIAQTSAFDPIGHADSSSLDIVVAAALKNQVITFKSPTGMTVGDSDQSPQATATSGLKVDITSNTPSTCTIDFSKIHPVAAGICSIKATQVGDSEYMAAMDVTKTLNIAADPKLPLANTATQEIPTSLGSAIYDPASPDPDYVSVLVAGSDKGIENSTLVKIIIPRSATSAKAIVLISAFSTDEESASGYFVARVAAVSASGTPIKQFDKNFEINIPAGSKGSTLFSSDDGKNWIPIVKIDTEELPAGMHVGYFIEDDGRVAILNHHFMMVGYRKIQEPLVLSLPVDKLTIGATTMVKSFGGSGAGEVTYSSTTQSICSISDAGVLTGLSKGDCLVKATKNASGIYANSVSKPATVKIVEPTLILKTPVAPVNIGFLTHSLTFLMANSTQTLDVGLCSIYANETADLYLGTRNKNKVWSWKKISSTRMDENGFGSFSITTKLQYGQMVRVMVNNVIQMESDV
ncbi:MAG: hypothetical protein F2954_03000 [Actinobacteria bacterium]|uniref:Unannotated protein n=1 Tax=freshwater metagenome TaxID=449393 RepID=A0A6J7VVE5_9ZZZZ|nr:hypothetical protein [Actinomycetota bacterium]